MRKISDFLFGFCQYPDKLLSLQRVIHSIRFKVKNRGCTAAIPSNLIWKISSHVNTFTKIKPQ